VHLVAARLGYRALAINRGLWPQVRAALLLLHLFAITLMALPAPVGADRSSNYEGPQARRELAQVSDSLARVGVEASPEQIAALSIGISKKVLALRRLALAPFRPYYSLFGTRQGYRMFSGVALYGDRLHVQVEEAGQWRTLYLARDDAHDWRGPAWDSELSRSMLYRYSGKRYRERYGAITKFVAREVALDYPLATRVRISLLHGAVQSPAEARAGEWPEQRDRRVRTIRLVR